MNTTKEKQEWEHIAIYESGKSDLATTILNLFENELDPKLKEWLEVEKTHAKDNVIEAESKL